MSEAGERWKAKGFFLIGSAAYFVFLLTISISSIDKALTSLLGIRLLHWLGTAPLFGPKKVLLLEAVTALCCTVTIVAFLRYFSKTTLKPVIGTLAVLCCLYFTTAALFFFPVYHNNFLNDLVTLNLPSIEYDRMFSKAVLTRKTAQIKDFNSLAQIVEKLFESKRIELASKWKCADNKQLKAFFYLNVVCRLWGYGNPTMVNRAGSVASNELNNFCPDGSPSAKQYVTSQIGCCTDYAFLMKVFLDFGKIPNRRVAIRGHVFNEAKLADGWYVLDACTGLAFQGSWKHIQNRPNDEPVKVTIFPHHNSIKGDPHYRKCVEQFRQRFIFMALEKSAEPSSIF